MRIDFLNFNLGSTVGINNGLAILSAVLKQAGHQVGLIHLSEDLGYGFDLERLRQDILHRQPDIIGISLMEPQFKYVKVLCEKLRSYYRGVVVCGGPFPSMDPESVLAIDAVDAVCLGEGEGALVELATHLEQGRDWTAIANLWVKRPDGSIVQNALRPFCDLSALPPEDKDLFDMASILPLKNFQLEATLGRGCIYKCTYCINDSYVKRYQKLCRQKIKRSDYTRTKPIDTVIHEIKTAIDLHPSIRKIAFIDDNFLMYPDFAIEFYQRYRQAIGLPFMCNINPMSFSLAKGRMLKQAGCDDIRFGIESGSERIKKQIMQRPISNESVKKAFGITRQLNMMASSFNMIGLPTETRDDVMATMMLNAAIMPETIKVMTFYPFKNTPLYELCEKMDLIDEDKKRLLDDYDTFTCLKFAPEHQLFLKKVQTAFNWHINVYLNNACSPHYATRLREIAAMDSDQWDAYDFDSADRELSLSMRKKGISHYAKFVNRSLAAKYPSRHYKMESC